MFTAVPAGERHRTTPVREGGIMPAATTGVRSGTPKTKKARKEAEQQTRKAKHAAILLKQVSDATRLQIILHLSEGERHVGALCENLDQSQPAVSHHLALLRHGGIIAPRRQGENNFYGLTDAGNELAKVVKTVIS